MARKEKPKPLDPKPENHPNKSIINKDQVLELCRRQWYPTAIASFLGVDRTTLYRHVSSTEMDQARQSGVARLREALFTRAMGGRIEKKNEDGTVTVQYLRSSDRLLKHALDRFDGAVTQTVELNPDPERPQQVNHKVDPETLKNVLSELDTEY